MMTMAWPWAMELQFEGQREEPRTRWFSQVLEYVKRRQKGWQEIEKVRLRED
jgi:hypothetical protein